MKKLKKQLEQLESISNPTFEQQGRIEALYEKIYS